MITQVIGFPPNIDLEEEDIDETKIIRGTQPEI